MCLMIFDSQQLRVMKDTTNHSGKKTIKKAIKNAVESNKDDDAMRQASAVAVHQPTQKLNKIESKSKSTKK